MIFISFITIFICAIGLWFFTPKEKKIYWVPILKILPPPPKKTALKFTRPPWISFICFFLICLIWSFLGFFSQKRSQNLSLLTGESVLLFADFSPSVSSYTELTLWKEQIYETWNQIKSKKKFFKTSHSKNVFQTDEDIKKVLDSLSWHRPGALLGTSLKENNFDHVIIMSDLDEFSWDDLLWNQKSFFLVPPKNLKSEKNDNIFISDIGASHEDHSRFFWNIQIAHTKIEEKIISGILEAKTQKGESLGSWNWSIPSKNLSMNLQATLAPIDETIVWTIKSEEQDAIGSDNIFFTFGNLNETQKQKNNILLINQSQGEQLLADPGYELKLILESLGFDVHQKESLLSSNFSENFLIWMVHPLDELFDTSLLSKKDLWITPALSSSGETFKKICTAIQKLRSETDTFCSSILSSDDLSAWLGSLKKDVFPLGHDQIWHLPKEHLVVFGFPLVPSIKNGLSYGTAPILLKELLKWQGSQGEQKLETWPRYNNAQDQKIVDHEISNVPKGESQMRQLESGPDLFFEHMQKTEDLLENKEIPEHIKYALFLIAGILLFEGLYGLLRKKNMKNFL